jgi:hypothetical protein
MYTVKHYNNITARWHVEEAAPGVIWTTDFDTAQVLADGHESMGFKAEVVEADTLTVEHLPFGGSLVEVDTDR